MLTSLQTEDMGSMIHKTVRLRYGRSASDWTLLCGLLVLIGCGSSIAAPETMLTSGSAGSEGIPAADRQQELSVNTPIVSALSIDAPTLAAPDGYPLPLYGEALSDLPPELQALWPRIIAALETGPVESSGRGALEIAEWVESTFVTWMQERGALTKEVEEAMDRFVSIRPDAVVFRAILLAVLHDDFSTKIIESPDVPQEFARFPDLQNEYLQSFQNAAVPVASRARAHYQTCTERLSPQTLHFGDWHPICVGRIAALQERFSDSQPTFQKQGERTLSDGPLHPPSPSVQ